MKFNQNTKRPIHENALENIVCEITTIFIIPGGGGGGLSSYILMISGPWCYNVIPIISCDLRDIHDGVVKWKHFPRKWPIVRGIHWSPVNSWHKGQRWGALMFSLICLWINDTVNNRVAGDLRRYRAQYDVIVMSSIYYTLPSSYTVAHLYDFLYYNQS